MIVWCADVGLENESGGDILSKRELMSAGDKGSEDGVSGVVS